MYDPQKAENGYTTAERAIFDAMVRAVQVKHESWRTGQAYGGVVFPLPEAAA
jgi:hypothetical protein